jgi:hypothetical protein
VTQTRVKKPCTCKFSRGSAARCCSRQWELSSTARRLWRWLWPHANSNLRVQIAYCSAPVPDQNTLRQWYPLYASGNPTDSYSRFAGAMSPVPTVTSVAPSALSRCIPSHISARASPFCR